MRDELAKVKVKNCCEMLNSFRKTTNLEKNTSYNTQVMKISLL